MKDWGIFVLYLTTVCYSAASAEQSELQNKNDVDLFLATLTSANSNEVIPMLKQNPSLCKANNAIVTVPLVYAARSSKPDVLAALLDAGADIQATDPSGDTALHEAAFLNSLDSVKLLVERGAKIEARNKLGKTPFIASCLRTENAEYLISKGADVTASSSNGENALFLVTDKALAKYIISKGVNVNAIEHDSLGLNLTPLFRTSAEITEVLLEAGADPNARDCHGGPPLHYAVRGNRTECAAALLAHKADIDAADNDGYTALHWASHSEVLELLLAKGANKEAKTNLGMTPLHYLAREGAKRSVEALIKAGAVVNAKDNSGMTPLDYAMKEKATAIVDCLKEHGGKQSDELDVKK